MYCSCVPQEVRVHITGGKLTRWPGYLDICLPILDLCFGLDHCAANGSLDFSTASVAELRQSLNELSQCQAIQPTSDFRDRFVSRRGSHIQVVQQSEIVEFTIGDSSYRWKFLKAAITDICILGLDFITHFKLDIKLSENTLVLGNSTIPIQVSPVKGNYTVNTVSLFKKFKILSHSGLNFSLRLLEMSTKRKQFYPGLNGLIIIIM